MSQVLLAREEARGKGVLESRGRRSKDPTVGGLGLGVLPAPLASFTPSQASRRPTFPGEVPTKSLPLTPPSRPPLLLHSLLGALSQVVYKT